MPFTPELPLRWSDADANGHLRHTVYPELGAEVRLAWLPTAALRAEGFEVSPLLRRKEG